MPIRDGGTVEFGVKITADNQVFINGVKAAGDELGKLRDQVKGAGDAADDARGKQENLTGAVVKGTGAVEILKRVWDEASGAIRAVVDVTQAAQQSQARLEAVLRATGNASGQTADTVNELADQMARLTVFDDRSIRDAATSLATFDAIAGDTFERIIKLSADLASTGRGDLQTWITILAKAGTEPVAAIGLIERALGKMDPALKIAIQNASDFNDKALAQKLLFDEITARVGGTATAAYSGLAREIGGTAKAWDDLKKEFGLSIFDSQTKEASALEKAIRGLADAFKFLRENYPTNGATGDPRAGFSLLLGGENEGPAPIDESAGLNMGRAYPPTAGTQQQASASDFLTIRQKQQLREQDLQNTLGYYDQVFKLAKDESDREIALLDYQHKAGLIDEQAYIAGVGALKVAEAFQDVDRIKTEIATQRQILAGEQAELSRAANAAAGGSVQAPAEVLAAEQKIHDTKAKINALTLDQVNAEKNVDEAVKQTDRDQDLAFKKLMDNLLATSRDFEDYRRGLEKQTEDMQAQVDLTFADTVAQQQAVNARKLRYDADTKILAIERQIEDLRKSGGNASDIAAKENEIRQINAQTDKAIVDQGNLIVQVFNTGVFKEIGVGVVDALLQGKNAITSLKNFFISEFNKLVVHPIFDPIFSGIAQAIFGGPGGGGAGGAGNAASGVGILANAGSAFANFLPSGSLGSSFAGVASGLGQYFGLAAETSTVLETVASFVPVVGVALGAVYGLYQAFKDKGENWQATLGFGANANAYTTQGVFGPEGFQSVQGDNGLNTQVQQFMAGTKPIDQLLAGNLTPAQIAQITTSLSGPYTNRNDGQPSQFAFGKGDNTAGQQLTLEYLQHKYGAVFDTIDKSFADHIRSFTGSSADLLKEIGDYATAFDGLKKLNIKGLDMNSLQAWQQAGETLPQTLQRIGTAYANFDAMFMSDSDKLTSAQTSVNDVFTKLGIAVPTSTDDFYKLVHGIDVSTQAGRDLVTQLLAVAPAFFTVAQAAAAAVGSFNAIASQLSPSFATGDAKGNFSAALSKWWSFDTANAGTDFNTAVGQIQALISGGNLEGAKQYALSLGGGNNTAALNALTAVFSTYQAWQGTMTSSSATVSTSFNNVAQAANGVASSLSGAKEGLKQWLAGLFLDQTLSPLTPQQRLDYSQDQYTEDLLKAQKNDPAAVAQLQALAQTYLSEALSFFGPGSQYESIFAAVTSQTGTIAGFNLNKPPTAADLKAGFGTVVTAIETLQHITGQLGTKLDSLGDKLKNAFLGAPSF